MAPLAQMADQKLSCTARLGCVLCVARDNQQIKCFGRISLQLVDHVAAAPLRGVMACQEGAISRL
jgi:hypothetical protein